jgi:hypothetical protein
MEWFRISKIIRILFNLIATKALMRKLSIRGSFHTIDKRLIYLIWQIWQLLIIKLTKRLDSSSKNVF